MLFPRWYLDSQHVVVWSMKDFYTINGFLISSESFPSSILLAFYPCVITDSLILLQKFTATVVSSLFNFTKMFNQAHKENCKQLELEMRKAAESKTVKISPSTQTVWNALI